VSEYGEKRDWLDILLPNVGLLVFLLKWKSNASKSFVVDSKAFQFVVYFTSQNISSRRSTVIITLPQLCFANSTCKCEKVLLF